jgi:5'-3' exonuclease
MGIPSFYRHLLRQYPKLVSRGVGSKQPEWLCLDFNCAMYHVLRTMRPFTPDAVTAWEKEFCDQIAAYMKALVVLVRPTKGAYVSCDGVVCAAKRQQQRMRRFKGPWFAAAEAEVKNTAMAGGGKSTIESGMETDAVAHVSASLPHVGMKATTFADASAALQPVANVWDQNALTPGSAFMAKLGTSLTTAGVRLSAQLKVPITVSTTSEPGEGEHKLLAAMRSVRPASCTIYGLDADLILLAMLLGAETGAEVRLLREAQEFESHRNSDVPEWRTLDIAGLTQVLIPSTTPAQVADFVAAMSLLGNDFLPRSLTRTVRGDGIPQILAGLREWVWPAGHRIVGADGRVSRDGLLALLGPWAAAEENDMLAVAMDAVRASRRPAGIGANPAETALKEWQASPARWCALGRLLAPNGKQLIPAWREVYRSTWHAGGATEYVHGVAWVWDYYSGKKVDQGWTFPAHLPPLWSDVVAALSAGLAGSVVAPPPIVWADPLPEWVHLLSVLPVASVRRLLPTTKQGLMTAEPWWWPDSWSLFDVGRGQMWECEPVIPMIPETVLRGL